METFRTLYGTTSARRRKQLVLTFVGMLLGAVAELVTIGAVLPFLALLTRRGAAAPLPRWLGALRLDDPLSASLLLVGAALVAAIIRLGLLWISQRTVMGLSHDIATTIFTRMLRQPYADYIRRNSGEVLASLEKVRDVASGVLQPVMQGAIATIMALCIGAFLLVLSPLATGVAAVAVGLAYWAVIRLTRRRLRSNSEVLATTAVQRTKLTQEALGGFRDIVLDRSQPLFEEEFAAIDHRFRRAIAVNAVISQGPRFAIEAAGIVAIALVALAMSFEPGGIVRAVPVLGALALGSQRLLPLLQQAYTGWGATLGNLQALEDIAALVSLPAPPPPPPQTEKLPFRDSLELRGVSFAYEEARPVLRDVDLAIRRGSRIGIVGPTGGGKSTLLDLIMGLLEPTEGEIRVDGRALHAGSRPLWQAQIAHVPQSIYLIDDGIAANIAFGVRRGRIDSERVRACARAARIAEFIDELPEGYDTRVGERGIRLSGGQRQRIGIARALYKGATVLILDEATSALDDATEAQVIESVMALGEEITILMIAHRRSTLAGCDRILNVEKGRVTEADPPARRGVA